MKINTFQLDHRKIKHKKEASLFIEIIIIQYEDQTPRSGSDLHLDIKFSRF